MKAFFVIWVCVVAALCLTNCGGGGGNKGKPDLLVPDIVNPATFNNGLVNGVLTLESTPLEVLKGPYFNGVTTICNTYYNTPLTLTGSLYLKNEFYSVTRTEFDPFLGRNAQVTYVWNTLNFPYQICLDSLQVGEKITVYKVITNNTSSDGTYDANSGSKTATKLIRVQDGKIVEQNKESATLVVPPRQFRVIKSSFNYEGPGDFIHVINVDSNNKIDEEDEGNNSKSDTSKGLVVR